MAKVYDASSKYLLEADPESWLRLFGIAPTGPVSVIDADLSTITSEADKVLRIGGPSPWLVHVEMQAARDRELARRLLRYHVLLDLKEGVPVHSVAVLLRPEVDGPDLSGTLHLGSPAGLGGLRFEYQVVRIWERPVGPILAGGPGTLPLAPVCDVPTTEVPDLLALLAARFRDEVPPRLGGSSGRPREPC